MVGYLGHGKCNSPLLSNVFSFKACTDQNIASHAAPAARNIGILIFASSVDSAWFFVSTRCCNKVMSCSFPQLDVLCFPLSGCLMFFHNWMSSVFP